MTQKAKYIFIAICLQIISSAAGQMNVFADIIETDSLFDKVNVFFGMGGITIDDEYRNNKKALFRLSELIEKNRSLDSTKVSNIYISAYTSPDGGVTRNRRYSKDRLDEIVRYLELNENLAGYNLHLKSNGVAWNNLEALVQRSDMSETDKNGVLYILKNVPEETWVVEEGTNDSVLLGSRLKELMRYKLGDTYRYMATHLFPNLRYVGISFGYNINDNTGEIILENGETLKMHFGMVTLPCKETTPLNPEKISTSAIAELIADTIRASTKQYKIVRKPIFAVKTNLLYDALTLANIEVEVPLGKQWSLSAEWMFPWWIIDNNEADSKRHRIQILNGNIEAKYWLGNRNVYPEMTGWFVGAYVGTGIYDLEFNAKGYQGEVKFMGGISGGYSHSINRSRNLRMEYSLGVGYAGIDYRHYEAFYDADAINIGQYNWHPKKLGGGSRPWIGPTKAKVSLVWMLDYYKKVNK